MSSLSDVAAFLKTTTRRLQHLLYSAPPAYRSFEIPKANGTTRTIEAPPRHIAAMQRRVADALSAIYAPSRTVHGFCKSRSIVSNARAHVAQALVLNVDLVDFFWQVHYGRVRGIFLRAPFNFTTVVANGLAQLCCTNRRLPQGAPTSPVLSNLACRGLDRQLAQLANAAGCRYTRYADDLTFSARRAPFPLSLVSNQFTSPPALGEQLVAIITRHGFSVSQEKVRVRTRMQRQEVTGLTVNRRVNVRRDLVREVRAALHCWRTFGLDEAQRRFLERHFDQTRSSPQPPLDAFLRGRLSFLKMVRCPNSGSGGIDDIVSARYLVEFAELARAHGFCIAGAAATNPFILTRSLWIVRGFLHGDEVCVGTAFSLDGYGIVTAAHVLDGKATRWTLQPAWALARVYPIAWVRVCARTDLAQIPPPGPIPAWLRVSPTPSVHGAPVQVAGFPEWSGPADRVRIERGHVTSVRMLSLVRHFLTSTSIAPGSSGGPVLDGAGAVAGVVRYGAESVVAPNSFVSIEHLADLAANGVVRLLPQRRAIAVERTS